MKNLVNLLSPFHFGRRLPAASMFGLTAGALGLALALAGPVDASAWTRTGAVTGQRGTATMAGSGSCAGGACTSQRTVTGPGGQAVTGQGSGSCANGSCTHVETMTGPAGQSVTRQSTISR